MIGASVDTDGVQFAALIERLFQIIIYLINRISTEPKMLLVAEAKPPPPKGVGASPTTPSFRSTVSGFT